MLETIKHKDYYYVLVKQFIHDVNTEESMLNMQIVRYRSGEEPTEVANIGVGQLGDGGRPGKTHGEACYHPTLISTLQNGRYLYFFRCGSDKGVIRKNRIQKEKDALAKAVQGAENEGGEIEFTSESGTDTWLEGGASAHSSNFDGSDKSGGE